MRPLASRVWLAVAAALVATTASAAVPRREPAYPAPGASAFVRTVAADDPVLHLRGPLDLVTGRQVGTVHGSPDDGTMPDGGAALVYSGGGYVSVPSRPSLSIPTTGRLSVEAWLRPSTRRFSRTEGSGYVQVLGKGQPGHQEWYVRIYSRGNAERRANRLSGYAFNPRGGLGSGAYVQEPVEVDRWIQVVVVYDTRSRPGAPTGTVTLYKDGQRRDVDALANFRVVPRAGPAPLRVGAATGHSAFEGAVGDVVVWDRALTAREVQQHWEAMREGPSS